MVKVLKLKLQIFTTLPFKYIIFYLLSLYAIIYAMDQPKQTKYTCTFPRNYGLLVTSKIFHSQSNFFPFLNCEHANVRVELMETIGTLQPSHCLCWVVC